MKLVHTIKELRDSTAPVRQSGVGIGLVPTMGALHEGHLALIRRAKEQCGFVGVSVFVNPTQFGPAEDFSRYPRTLPDDVRASEQAGADIVFAPDVDEMYPHGFSSTVDVGGISRLLEGRHRPGHFNGVTTVCLKLFNIFQADRAYFGQKDYQQLQVVKQLVRDLNIPIEIVPVGIVREPDGLAMSSRNRYLNPEERRAALVLRDALEAALSAYRSGQIETEALEREMSAVIAAQPLASIDYAVVVDAETLQHIDRVYRPAVALLAVRIGATRLIDNCLITQEMPNIVKL